MKKMCESKVLVRVLLCCVSVAPLALAAKAQPPAGEGAISAKPAQLLPITNAGIEKLVGMPTMLTVNFQDTPIKEAIAEISRQANCKIELREFGAKGKFDDMKVSLQATQKPFWQVMEQLLVPRNLTVASSPMHDAQGKKIDLQVMTSSVKAPETVPAEVRPQFQQSNPFFTFKILGATHNQAVATNYTGILSNTSAANQNLSLSFGLMLDPHLKDLPLRAQVVLEEITDENGASLRTFGMGSSVSHGDGLVQTFWTPLLPDIAKPGQQNITPAVKATKIAHLKGHLVVALQTRHETWEIENLQDIKNVSKTFLTTYGPINATVVGFWGDTGHYRVPVRLEGQIAGWQAIGVGQRQPILFDVSFGNWPQKGQLLDANGGAYSYGGGGGSSSNRASYYEMVFGDLKNQGLAQDAPQLGPPQKLVFDVPTEARQLEIPFEIKDLPLP